MVLISVLLELLTQAQTLDQRTVAINVGALQVVEQACDGGSPCAADHGASGDPSCARLK